MEVKEAGKLKSLNEELFGKRLRVIHQKFVNGKPQVAETTLSSGTIRAFAQRRGTHDIFENTLDEMLKNSGVDSVTALYILGFSLTDPKTAEIISLEMIYSVEAADTPDWSHGKKWIRKVGMDFMLVNRA